MTNAITLAGRLADLLHVEHGAMADFLLALADFDRRRAWVELGYPSLFSFLHRRLGLSKGAAHYRMTAAKLVQRFPEIVDPLRDGRLCITSMVPLAKVLTLENRKEVLPRFFQRSKREAMAVAAAIQPATAVPRRDVVTAVRPTAAATEPGAAGLPVPPMTEAGAAVGTAASVTDPGAPVLRSATEPAAAPPSPSRETEPRVPLAVQPVELNLPPPSLHPRPARRDAAEPLTADLSRLHITVSRRFLEKLEAARAALSHTHPLATAEEILEAGLDLVLERHLRRKGLLQKQRQQAVAQQEPTKVEPPSREARQSEPTDREQPQQQEPSPASSYIPAAVRREVWIRDGGRCQWPLESGGICGSTLGVEFQHRIPVAMGGPSTAENICLHCRFHNVLAARAAFGDEVMNRYSREAARDGRSQPDSDRTPPPNTVGKPPQRGSSD